MYMVSLQPGNMSYMNIIHNKIETEIEVLFNIKIILHIMQGELPLNRFHVWQLCTKWWPAMSVCSMGTHAAENSMKPVLEYFPNFII